MLNTVAVHHDVYSMMMHLQVFKVFPRDQGCGELHGCFLAGRTKLTTDFKFRGREWQITVGRWRKKTMVGNKYSDGQTIMLILIHASDLDWSLYRALCVVCSGHFFLWHPLGSSLRT
jgi:hypothetical protein